MAEDYDLEVELERSELVELVDRALGLLPTGTRDALIGRFVDGTPPVSWLASSGYTRARSACGCSGASSHCARS